MSDYIEHLMNGDLEKAKQVRVASIPDELYKFFPLNGRYEDEIFQTLRDKQIHLSALSEFNDPFEGIGLYFNKDRFSELSITSNEVDAMENEWTSLLGG